MRTATLLALMLSVVLGPVPDEAQGKSVALPLTALVRSADRVFRGTCTRVDRGFVEVAGGRFDATTFTFQVAESLKGRSSATLRFRQVGTPEGGALDLGQVGGLPVYRVGVEYLLFLLPVSRAGLTSPVAAFAIEADGALVRVDRPSVAGTRTAAPMPGSYASMRAAVLAQVGR